jgi:hypothetical protein
MEQIIIILAGASQETVEPTNSTGYYVYEVPKGYTNVPITNDSSNSNRPIAFAPKTGEGWSAGDEAIVELYTVTTISTKYEMFTQAFEYANYGGAGTRVSIYGDSGGELVRSSTGRTLFKFLYWEKDADEFGFVSLGAINV